MCLLDRVFPLIVVTSVKRGDVGQVCLSLGRGAVERGVTGQALMRHNIAWKDQNDITKTSSFSQNAKYLNQQIHTNDFRKPFKNYLADFFR